MNLLVDKIYGKIYYIKLWYIFTKNTLNREFDYRGNIIAEIVDSLLNLACNIIFFDILYLNVESISGWNNNEILVLIAISQIIISLVYMFFMNNLPRIQGYVFKGDLDYILLKPCDGQFFVSFRYFYFGAVPNLVFSIILLVYAVVKMNINLDIFTIIVFIVHILSGVIICYSLWIIIMSISFIVLKIGQMHELFLSMLRFLEYPRGVYKGVFRFIFIYILPIVAISNIPAEYILGKIKFISSIYIIGIAVIFFSISRVIWKRLLIQYSSASS